MTYSLCIDIGGTFTDCMVSDASGALQLFKAPSTPEGFEQGFIDVLEIAAAHYGMPLEAFLGQVETIVHGTTVATNALVEGKVGRVGFITNEGFPDILTLREAPRKRSFEWKLHYPDPFVPRKHTCTVRGRIDADGNEVTPLREGDVLDAIAHFKRLGVQSIGVCFLWSSMNGSHERRVAEIIHGEWPGLPVTLSHELNPIPREYRRAISAVIDASLRPIVSAYVEVLSSALRGHG